MLLQEYTGQEPEKKLLSDKEFEVFYKDLAACIDRHKALQEQKTAVHAAAERLSEWGAFSPAELRSLGDQGLDIHIYRTDKKTAAALAADPDVRVIRLAPVGKMPTLASIGPLPAPYPVTEFPIPEKGLEELNQEWEDCDRGIRVCEAELHDANKQELSNMMVGRPVQLQVVKEPAQPKDPVLRVRHMCVASHQHKRDAVHDVSLEVRAGEIVCIAGIDGNGQTEFVQGLTGLDKITGGTVELCGKNITHTSIRRRGENMSHIPEDRHKHGLILDFTLEQNMVLQRYLEPQFQKAGFIKNAAVREYAQHLIDQYDVRSGQGPVTIARSMSGGNQQKAIIAREVDRDKSLIVAVQPTRGLDVGAIEYIHSQLVAERDRGKAVLLVSLELDEVMSLSDRILVMYEGQLVGQLNPKTTTVAELGLYMSGAKRDDMGGDQA